MKKTVIDIRKQQFPDIPWADNVYYYHTSIYEQINFNYNSWVPKHAQFLYGLCQRISNYNHWISKLFFKYLVPKRWIINMINELVWENWQVLSARTQRDLHEDMKLLLQRNSFEYLWVKNIHNEYPADPYFVYTQEDPEFHLYQLQISSTKKKLKIINSLRDDGSCQVTVFGNTKKFITQSQWRTSIYCPWISHNNNKKLIHKYIPHKYIDTHHKKDVQPWKVNDLKKRFWPYPYFTKRNSTQTALELDYFIREIDVNNFVPQFPNSRRKHWAKAWKQYSKTINSFLINLCDSYLWTKRDIIYVVPKYDQNYHSDQIKAISNFNRSHVECHNYKTTDKSKYFNQIKNGLSPEFADIFYLSLESQTDKEEFFRDINIKSPDSEFMMFSKDRNRTIEFYESNFLYLINTNGEEQNKVTNRYFPYLNRYQHQSFINQPWLTKLETEVMIEILNEFWCSKDKAMEYVSNLTVEERRLTGHWFYTSFNSDHTPPIQINSKTLSSRVGIESKQFPHGMGFVLFCKEWKIDCLEWYKNWDWPYFNPFDIDEFKVVRTPVNYINLIPNSDKKTESTNKDNLKNQYTLLKQKSEQLRESAQLDHGVYWYQVQEGTTRSSWLDANAISEFEETLWFLFPTTYKKYLETMSWTNKSGINIYGNSWEAPTFSPLFYSYPQDLEKILEQIDRICESFNISRDQINGDDIPYIVPIVWHRFFVFDNQWNETILSMYGNDVIPYANTLPELIEDHIFNGGKPSNKLQISNVKFRMK
jgi:hypothetical protein